MLTEHLGSIPSDYNFREDILAIEIDKVFKASWLCVGFIEDLANHNDYITANIGHCGIVVQNFKGKLKAFRNVCTHRFSRVQCAPKGNRTLTCPYHGWTFDENGVPVGIPFKDTFGLSEEARNALALESYAVDTCGRFVFVRMQPTGPSLREYLGEVYDALDHLTGVFTDKFESVTLEWEGNWKVGMDNAAEGYHVPLVHPETFAVVLTLDLKCSTEKEHGIYSGILTDRSRKWWDNVKKNIGMRPSPRYPEYANFLIFPNIVVTLSYGGFLTFQTMEPIDARRLRLNSSAWMADNKGGAARDAVVTMLKEFSHKVREEDRVICRETQLGVRDFEAVRPPVLGEMEGRISHFQKSYAKRMGLI